ncbi:hypothetical protein CMV50_10360 [Escherichia coli]|nr:hypothetical protein CMV50_10360 [Escherichia coli]
MKKLKTPNNRGLGVLGADKVLVVFAGCGANALPCLQNHAKSVYCNYLVADKQSASGNLTFSISLKCPIKVIRHLKITLWFSMRYPQRDAPAPVQSNG